MPVGTIVDFAADNPPNGWLKCDGSTVSRTGFSDLFAVISTNYGSGNGSTTFTLPDITGAIIFATPLDKRIKVLTPPQYVSALPAAPIDGQEVYYQASAASGVIWHLRYNATSSSSYKWEFVGGPSLLVSDNAVSNYQFTTSWTALNGSITIPLAGDYDVSFGAVIYGDSATGRDAYLKVATGTPSNTTDAILCYTYNGVGRDQTYRSARLTGLSASATLQIWGQAGSGTVTAERRNIVARPVRVG